MTLSPDELAAITGGNAFTLKAAPAGVVWTAISKEAPKLLKARRIGGVWVRF